jgi:hypothetical protein
MRFDVRHTMIWHHPSQASPAAGQAPQHPLRRRSPIGRGISGRSARYDERACAHGVITLLLATAPLSGCAAASHRRDRRAGVLSLRAVIALLSLRPLWDRFYSAIDFSFAGGVIGEAAPSGLLRGIKAARVSRRVQRTDYLSVIICPASRLQREMCRQVSVQLGSTLSEGTMRDKPRSWSAPLSRRALLRGTAGAAGAATILGATANPAASAPKMSQKVVAYQDHPDGDKRCDKCGHFQPPNACKVVEGTVSPEGFCRFFVPVGRA